MDNKATSTLNPESLEKALQAMRLMEEYKPIPVGHLVSPQTFDNRKGHCIRCGLEYSDFEKYPICYITARA